MGFLKRNRVILAIIGITLFFLLIFRFTTLNPLNSTNKQSSSSDKSMSLIDKVKKTFNRTTFSQLDTNLDKAIIEPSEVRSGGPGKDGIPAIDNPKFVSIAEASLDDEIRGIFIDINGEQRFYPYSILVWHEIVNDSIGDTNFAVTFCPLCGTAIVFDRDQSSDGPFDKTVRFGVSGLLWESNLLMYDDITETLWSQARGQAVIGDLAGQKLIRLPMQLITFGELKQKYPSSQVLSHDTGYNRNYTVYPYGDYEENNDRLVFPVSVQDNRFPSKLIMYVVQFEDKSVAVPKDSVVDGSTATMKVNRQTLTLKRDGGEYEVTANGEVLPGYFEMWFSWATHHQEDGVVWEI